MGNDLTHPQQGRYSKISLKKTNGSSFEDEDDIFNVANQNKVNETKNQSNDNDLINPTNHGTDIINTTNQDSYQSALNQSNESTEDINCNNSTLKPTKKYQELEFDVDTGKTRTFLLNKDVTSLINIKKEFQAKLKPKYDQVPTVEVGS